MPVGLECHYAVVFRARTQRREMSILQQTDRIAFGLFEADLQGSCGERVTRSGLQASLSRCSRLCWPDLARC